MTRIRIGFGTAVVATAVLFFLSGSYFTAGVFIIEILLPVVLRFFLRLETNGMELEMHTRSACRLGQTIEIDISVKSRWRCLAQPGSRQIFPMIIKCSRSTGISR